MAKRRVLVSVAVTAEAAGLVRRLGLGRAEGAGGGIVYRGGHGGREVVVGVTGMGGERAARVTGELLERFEPGLVIIAGFAGALDGGLVVGDAIRPARVIDGESGRSLAPSVDGGLASGALVTSVELASTRGGKAELGARHGARAVDMETARIAGVCEERGVGWACVRVISDGAEEDVPVWLMKLSRPDGRADVWGALWMVLRRPWRVRRLVGLGRRSVRLSEDLAGYCVGLMEELGG